MMRERISRKRSVIKRMTVLSSYAKWPPGLTSVIRYKPCRQLHFLTATFKLKRQFRPVHSFLARERPSTATRSLEPPPSHTHTLSLTSRLERQKHTHSLLQPVLTGHSVSVGSWLCDWPFLWCPTHVYRANSCSRVSLLSPPVSY